MRTFFFAAVMLSALAASSTSAQPQAGQPHSNSTTASRAQALEIFQSAFALWQSGDFATAEQAFATGLELDPDNLAANYYLGDLLRRRGDAVGARLRFERAVAIGGASPEFFRARAALYEIEGRNADGSFPPYAAYRAVLSPENFNSLVSSVWMRRMYSAAGWKVLQYRYSEMVDPTKANVACIGADFIQLQDVRHLASLDFEAQYLHILPNNSVERARRSANTDCTRTGPTPTRLMAYTTDPPADRVANDRFDLGFDYHTPLSAFAARATQDASARWFDGLGFVEQDSDLVPGATFRVSMSYHDVSGGGSYRSEFTLTHQYDCTLGERVSLGRAEAEFPFQAQAIQCARHSRSTSFTRYPDGGARTQGPDISTQTLGGYFVVELGLRIPNEVITDSSLVALEAPGRWRIGRPSRFEHQGNTYYTDVYSLVVAPG